MPNRMIRLLALAMALSLGSTQQADAQFYSSYRVGYAPYYAGYSPYYVGYTPYYASYSPISYYTGYSLGTSYTSYYSTYLPVASACSSCGCGYAATSAWSCCASSCCGVCGCNPCSCVGCGSCVACGDGSCPGGDCGLTTGSSSSTSGSSSSGQSSSPTESKEFLPTTPRTYSDEPSDSRSILPGGGFEMPLKGESSGVQGSESYRPIPQKESGVETQDESQGAAELLPLDLESSIAYRVNVPRSRVFYQARYHSPVAARVRVQPGMHLDGLPTKIAAR